MSDFDIIRVESSGVWFIGPDMPLKDAIQRFIREYDRTDPHQVHIAKRLDERIHAELYRREREYYEEWVDIGGEG
jgi:hypothetical protein